MNNNDFATRGLKEKKIRISFVLFGAYPLFNPECKATFGGAEVQMYQTAAKLAKHENIDVSFLVGDFGQSYRKRYDNVDVIRAYLKSERKIRYVTGLIYYHSLFRSLLRADADAYIVMCAGSITAVISLYCRLFNKKFIFMSASTIDVDGSYRKEYPFDGSLYEYGLKRADVVIVQNETDRKSLLRLYKKKSSVLKNPFVIPRMTELAKEREFVLWVGRCVGLKQPEVFLRLAEKTPQESFVMILPEQDKGLRNEISENAKGLSNLRIIEKVPFSEIGEYFRKSKVFMNTSTYEGFPNTFIQAAMYGVPILSLNVNPDNFLDEYDCGACARGDEKLMADQLGNLLENPGLWDLQSRNARKYAEENHDIERNVSELKTIIENICTFV